VIESSAAETCKTTTKKSDPQLAGFGIDVESADDAPGQAVGFFPASDLTGRFVEARQAVFRAHPHFRSVDLYRKDMIVGQSALDG